MDAGQAILVGIAALFSVAVWRRRENLLHNLRVLLTTLAVAVVAYVLAHGAGWNANQSALAAILAEVVVVVAAPRRSRHIPARVRRRVVARWEYDTGKKFNSRKYDLDHVVPFSKGGSSTEDNLRVLEKRKNRAKRAKAPWWDLLGRR